MRPAKRKAARDPDPHAQSVYEWEYTWRDWNRNTVEFSTCCALLRQACQAFKLKPPRLLLRDGTSSYARIGAIELSRDEGLNPATVLHEAAHHITNTYTKGRAQPHGPAFVATYITLLELAEVAPREALHASARAAGLKWRKS